MGKYTISLKGDKKVKTALQSVVTDLLALGLMTKQAHWNLRGTRFLGVHKQLDVIVDAVRKHTDEVAERLAAFGEPVAGTAKDVAKSNLKDMPAGLVSISDAVNLISERLTTAIETTRKGAEDCSEIDPVSEDLLIGVAGDLEQQRWLFSSDVESPSK